MKQTSLQSSHELILSRFAYFITSAYLDPLDYKWHRSINTCARTHVDVQVPFKFQHFAAWSAVTLAYSSGLFHTVLHEVTGVQSVAFLFYWQHDRNRTRQHRLLSSYSVGEDSPTSLLVHARRVFHMIIREENRSTMDTENKSINSTHPVKMVGFSDVKINK